MFMARQDEATAGDAVMCKWKTKDKGIVFPRSEPCPFRPNLGKISLRKKFMICFLERDILLLRII